MVCQIWWCLCGNLRSTTRSTTRSTGAHECVYISHKVYTYSTGVKKTHSNTVRTVLPIGANTTDLKAKIPCEIFYIYMTLSEHSYTVIHVMSSAWWLPCSPFQGFFLQLRSMPKACEDCSIKGSWYMYLHTCIEIGLCLCKSAPNGTIYSRDKDTGQLSTDYNILTHRVKRWRSWFPRTHTGTLLQNDICSYTCINLMCECLCLHVQ